MGGGLVVIGIMATAYLTINDMTVVGIADGFLIAPSIGLISSGAVMIFG